MCVCVFVQQQQSVQEDVFPDAEGWENMDPEEAAKWAVGSHFPPAEGEYSQTETGPAAQMHTGITECLSNIGCTNRGLR